MAVVAAVARGFLRAAVPHQVGSVYQERTLSRSQDRAVVVEVHGAASGQPELEEVWAVEVCDTPTAEVDSPTTSMDSNGGSREQAKAYLARYASLPAKVAAMAVTTKRAMADDGEEEVEVEEVALTWQARDAAGHERKRSARARTGSPLPPHSTPQRASGTMTTTRWPRTSSRRSLLPHALAFEACLTRLLQLMQPPRWR